jgi:hypothetical protein
MSTDMNRRAILAGGIAAALPATVIPSVAATPDPIFAAIEEYRTAWADFFSKCSAAGRSKKQWR